MTQRLLTRWFLTWTERGKPLDPTGRPPSRWRAVDRGEQGPTPHPRRDVLREDVEVFAAEQKAKGFADTQISRDTTICGDHGRIETRTTTVIHDVEWLQERHDWPGLKAVVMVESSREIGGKTEQETRFYLTSLVMAAVLLGPLLRSHWVIENSLHWVMDMIFRDD